MKTQAALMISTLFIAMIVLITFAGFSIPDEKNRATTGGEMTFTVRTVSAGGNFAPKHVSHLKLI